MVLLFQLYLIFPGTVTDNATGIANVKVSIKDTTLTNYWTGSAWTSSTEIWLSATGGLIWTIGPGSWSSGTNYLVRSKATDEATNEETSGSGNSFTYLIDDQKPTSTIVLPANNAKLKTLETITGTAMGPAPSSGLPLVKVSIKREVDTNYWTGSTWAAGAENWLDASGTNNWSIGKPSSGWEDGKVYLIRSKAIDSSSNQEDVKPGSSWTYDISNPSTTITAVTNNAKVNSLPSITGDITDNAAGVNYVKVSIKMLQLGIGIMAQVG